MNRISIIDYMKAMGMLTIIWGHIMLEGITNEVVYAFHIPLFFFMSGLVFSPGRYPEFSGFVKRKMMTLVVPYTIFSLVTWCVWVGYTLRRGEMDGWSIWSPLLQTLIAQGSGGFLVHNVPLWFVTCLFVVEIMYYYIYKLPFIWKIIVCIFCAYLGCWMTRKNDFFDFTLLPWNIEVALAAVTFYAIGAELSNRISIGDLISIIRRNRIKCVLIFVVSCLWTVYGAHMNGSISMGRNQLNNFYIFYPTAICGICAMGLFCVALEKVVTVLRLDRGIQWFGMNSFNAMAVHNPIKGIIVVLVAACTGESSSVVCSNYVFSLIAFVVTLIVTVVVMLFINQLKSMCKRKQMHVS